MFSPQTDALLAAEHWLDRGHKVALATVIGTWGSAPRQPGSQIAVCDDTSFVGSVSGGCAEGAVIEAAMAAIADGKIRRLEFGVEDQAAWSVGLACGGKIDILVEPFVTGDKHRLVAATNAARRQQRAIVRAVDLETGDSQLIEPAAASALAATPLAQHGAGAAKADRSVIAHIDGRRWFFIVTNPPIDLVVVGAVHIAQPLCRIGEMMGHHVRLIDPRTSFATPERFPGIAIVHAFPDEALRETPLTCRSALVVLSHDPKIDDPALLAALPSPAFYIGALGSKKTQESRRQRLEQHGIFPQQLARIHGPVGLAIGAKSPEEIAVSILAEMTLALRRPV